jgi:DNA-directed RNA polymerase sigma subunit (sigma70/sigma32)
LDEAIQEGIEGLISAVERYEPQRNLKFSTFATHYVTNKIRRCFQSATTPTVRLPALYYQDKIRYKGIMRDYYTSGKDIPPLQDIAKEMGITYQRLQRTLRYTAPVASLDVPLKSSRPNLKTVETESMANFLEDKGNIAAEDAVEMSFLRQALESAMANELSPIERDCLRLRLGLDDGVSRSTKEIAQATGGLLTYNAVNSYIQRAYRKLRSPQSLATYKLLAYLDFAGIDSATITKVDL